MNLGKLTDCYVRLLDPFIKGVHRMMLFHGTRGPIVKTDAECEKELENGERSNS